MTITSEHRIAAATDAGHTGVAFEGVSKAFPDGTAALTPITFSVEPGEFVAVVGPSGCGKSTLLRLASGLSKPTTGTITVAPEALGYVFQDATLLPWRTVRRNVELLGDLRGFPREKTRAAARAAIETVGLTGCEDKYPRALSGGMRMRASLARALTMAPMVFLFDEPFGALDEITRERLNDELLRLFADRQFAALFVTHSVTEAVFLASRVLVMSGQPGRIVADVEVPFGYPRPPEIRYDTAFVEVAGRVGAALREGHS